MPWRRPRPRHARHSDPARRRRHCNRRAVNHHDADRRRAADRSRRRPGLLGVGDRHRSGAPRHRWREVEWTHSPLLGADLSTSAIRSICTQFRAQRIGRFATRRRLRSNALMAPRFMMILTGRDLPTIRQERTPQPSIINEKTLADFNRVIEQTGILRPKPKASATATAVDRAD
jgi:hypothetical protein